MPTKAELEAELAELKQNESKAKEALKSSEDKATESIKKSTKIESNTQLTDSQDSEEEVVAEEGFIVAKKTVTTVIQARKIQTIKPIKDGAILSFGKDFDTITVNKQFVDKFAPRAGGYYTICKEGCKGYISDAEFEEFEEVKKK